MKVIQNQVCFGISCVLWLQFIIATRAEGGSIRFQLFFAIVSLIFFAVFSFVDPD